MTTPTSGAIGLLDIQTEFGGVAPIGIDEYYAGGAYVPAGLFGVPSTGAIGVGDFYNKTKTNWGSLSVNTSSIGEGGILTFFFTPVSGVPDGTYYYNLELLSNIQSSDFSTPTSGSFLLSGGTAYIDIQVAQDTSIEGVGYVRLVIGESSGVPDVRVASGTVAISDYYTAWINAPSRSAIYRYANVDTSYTTTTYTVGTSGLIGGTLTWALEAVNGGAPTTADLVATSGSVAITAGATTASITLTAAAWAGNSIPSDKTFTLVVTLPDGSPIRTLASVTVIASPIFVTGVSPSTIREGQSTTISLASYNVPLGAARLYYTMSGTASPTTDWYGGVTQNITDLNQEYQVADIYAAIDSVSEGTESLTFNWRINSYTGPIVASLTFNIQNQAVITSASASYNNAQITSVSMYPADRTFSFDYSAAGGTWTNAGSVTVGTWQTSSNSIVLYTNTGTNNGTHSMQYRFSAPGYDTYTISNSEYFTFPVDTFNMNITGTNSNGSSRSIYCQIGNTLPYGSARTFTAQSRIKLPGASTWNAWIDRAQITVAANATASPTTLVYGPVTAVVAVDVQFRCVLAGHEPRESNILYSQWLA